MYVSPNFKFVVHFFSACLFLYFTEYYLYIHPCFFFLLLLSVIQCSRMLLIKSSTKLSSSSWLFCCWGLTLTLTRQQQLLRTTTTKVIRQSSSSSTQPFVASALLQLHHTTTSCSHTRQQLNRLSFIHYYQYQRTQSSQYQISSSCLRTKVTASTNSCSNETSNNHDNDNNPHNSVTGTVYESTEMDQETPIVVKLFTKEGCTLCDKVKDVLRPISTNEYPHTLMQVDITDTNHKDWYERYKYDIPVLHINDMYWTKHRLSTEDAIIAFQQVRQNQFHSPLDEPNAGKLERRKVKESK